MKKFLITFIVIFALPVVFAADFPRPVGYVNDFANILPSRAEFEEGLRLYEENTTIEAVVVTLESLPEGHTLFTYGVELFEAWGIGKKGEDNGLLILIAKDGTAGNRLRIEVGYGLQGYITGAEAGRILDEALPYYEQGDYESALDIILISLSDELDNYVPGQQVERKNELLFNIILPNLPLIIFAIIIIVSIAASNRCPYCFGPLKCSSNECVCKKCGRHVSRKKRYAPVLIGGGGHGGGGFGGFGGGGSGGGGAGR